MLRFNLLPPELHTRLLFSKKTKRVFRYGNFLLGLLAIFTLFLLFALSYLQKQQAFFAQELGEIRANQQNTRIEVIKKTTSQFNEGLRAYLNTPPSQDWYQFLTEFSELVPDDVTLQSLTVQTTDQTQRITIEGISLTRERLRAFETILRNSSHLQDIESPLTNYQQPTDIKFTFSFSFLPHNE